MINGNLTNGVPPIPSLYNINELKLYAYGLIIDLDSNSISEEPK
jgi:hypothetical protein